MTLLTFTQIPSCPRKLHTDARLGGFGRLPRQTKIPAMTVREREGGKERERGRRGRVESNKLPLNKIQLFKVRILINFSDGIKTSFSFVAILCVCIFSARCSIRK